jgi:ubiquinone/menaquinone biosynthesis C-methylase UbiE
VPRHVRLRELLVGVEGLALLRRLYDGSDEDADRRLTEIRRLLDDEAVAISEPTSEADPVAGYGSWSENYDETANQIVELEQPVVWGLIEPLPPGRALDAACGTGRHAKRLVELGHEVTGVDLTPAMLRRAREGVPEATFVSGDLRALPLEDGVFDVAACGLALSHFAELAEPLCELGRVLKTGGHLIVSVLHPFQVHLGWYASFRDERGERAFVREHPHTHADFISAFRAAGLELVECVEPRFDPAHARAKRRAFEHIPEAVVAAYQGLPGVLVWDVRKR